MARQLWLLRHGDAEPHGSRPDAERALTARGEAQSLAAGRAMQALGCEFDACFTSPKVRAAETARLAAPPLGLEVVEHPPLHSGWDRRDALELMEVGNRVLVVGHEPDFSQVVYDLANARIDLKKGGIAVVRLDGSAGGALVALMRPRELEALSAGG